MHHGGGQRVRDARPGLLALQSGGVAPAAGQHAVDGTLPTALEQQHVVLVDGPQHLLGVAEHLPEKGEEVRDAGWLLQLICGRQNTSTGNE